MDIVEATDRVNDARSRMISLVADGIITDQPEMAQQVLTDRLQFNTMFGQSFVSTQHRDESP